MEVLGVEPSGLIGVFLYARERERNKGKASVTLGGGAVEDRVGLLSFGIAFV